MIELFFPELAHDVNLFHLTRFIVVVVAAGIPTLVVAVSMGAKQAKQEMSWLLIVFFALALILGQLF